MRASFLFSLTSFGAVVLSQDLAGLPVCAQTAAVTAATNSGCSLTDASCLCNNDGFISSLKATISGSCAGTDQQAACAWGNSACAAFDVSIDCNLAAAGPSSADIPATSATPTGSSSLTSNADIMSMASSAMATDGAGAASSTSNVNGMATESMLSSMMTSMMTENGTTTCTHGCGNMTHAATSMVSKTGSAPTSQYTGSASTAARHSGFIGVVIGAALVFALL